MTRFAHVKYLLFACRFLSILACTPRSFDDLIVQANFNVSRFLGLWFEIKWLPAAPHNESDIWRNFYQIYQLNNSNPNELLAYGRAQILNNETCFNIPPWSILINNNSPKMIRQSISATSKTPLYQPFYMITTDYDHYALIYSCIDMNYSSNQSCVNSTFWVFSRTISLSASLTLDLDENIKKQLCLNLTNQEITPHDTKRCYSSSSSKIICLNFILWIFTIIPLCIM